jgi:hypothetical protein
VVPKPYTGGSDYSGRFFDHSGFEGRRKVKRFWTLDASGLPKKTNQDNWGAWGRDDGRISPGHAYGNGGQGRGFSGAEVKGRGCGFSDAEVKGRGR